MRNVDRSHKSIDNCMKQHTTEKVRVRSPDRAQRHKIARALLMMSLTLLPSTSLLAAEIRTVLKPSEDYGFFDVPRDSVIEVIGGDVGLYGGALVPGAELGVDVFPIGRVTRGTLLAGFTTYTITSGSFLTMKIMTGEEGGLQGLIIGIPGQQTLVTMADNEGLKVLSAPMQEHINMKGAIAAAPSDGQGGLAEEVFLGVEAGDVLFGFARYRLGNVELWPYMICKRISAGELGGSQKALTLVIENSDDGQLWNVLDSRAIAVTETRQFFRARIEE